MSVTITGKELLPCKANDTFGPMAEQELEAIEANVEAACVSLLEALGIAWKSDPNCQDTPKRMARMYVRELCAGRFTVPPDCTSFPTKINDDQLYTVGPIAITSLCSHHFLPFTGHCWIGILPPSPAYEVESRVLGLSKYARLAKWVFARPQIQEEATVQLASLLHRECPNITGLAVVVKAKHFCMSMRGVKDDEAEMTTSVMYGKFRDTPSLRQEFLSLIGMQHI